jgi:hypothetical protein
LRKRGQRREDDEKEKGDNNGTHVAPHGRSQLRDSRFTAAAAVITFFTSDEQLFDEQEHHLSAFVPIQGQSKFSRARIT